MTTNQPPEGFPTAFGPDVTVRDIDLTNEEFVVGGERLTEERADELAERARRLGGRPSLTAPGRHSPALNLRISDQAKRRLAAVARPPHPRIGLGWARPREILATSGVRG